MRQLIALFSVLCVVGGVAGCTTPPPVKPTSETPPHPYNLLRAQEGLLAAQTAWQQKEVDAARQQSDAALQEWPGLVEGWALRQSICAAQQDHACTHTSAVIAAHLQALEGQTARSLALAMRHLAETPEKTAGEAEEKAVSAVKEKKDKPIKPSKAQGEQGEGGGITQADRQAAAQVAALYEAIDPLARIRTAPVLDDWTKRHPEAVPAAAAVVGGAVGAIMINNGGL